MSRFFVHLFPHVFIILFSDCGFWYYTHSSKTDDRPCDISYSPNNTLFGSKAICSCKRGYQINSTRTSIAAECTSNMQWNIESPPDCSPISKIHS
jgi:hypothetical protein